MKTTTRAFGTTVLLVFVPAVDSLRAKAERLGGFLPAALPAHLTLLYPFVPVRELAAETNRELQRLARGHLPLELTLRRTGRFEGVLWLDPGVEVNPLVADVRKTWPHYPPYGDPKFVVVPHVTLAQTDDRAILDRIEMEIACELPLTVIAHTLSVLWWDGLFWSAVESSPPKWTRRRSGRTSDRRLRR